MNNTTTCLLIVAIVVIICLIVYLHKQHWFGKFSCPCHNKQRMFFNAFQENMTTNDNNPKNVETGKNDSKEHMNIIRKTTRPRETFIGNNEESGNSIIKPCHKNLNDHINREVANYVVTGGAFPCANGENIADTINNEIYDYYGNMYSTELEKSEASQFNFLNDSIKKENFEPMASYSKDGYPISEIDYINNSVANYVLPAAENKKKD